jgi:hypothetical protein
MPEETGLAKDDDVGESRGPADSSARRSLVVGAEDVEGPTSGPVDVVDPGEEAGEESDGPAEDS